MCAITRLLDDAATCFLNWSSVMSATGTLYFALCSSRLQMYRKQRADGRGRGDARLLLLLLQIFRLLAPAELLVLVLALSRLVALVPARSRGRARAPLV